MVIQQNKFRILRIAGLLPAFNEYGTSGNPILCNDLPKRRYPDGISPKKKQLAAYLRENPGVSSKSYIARQLGLDVTAVRKYYNEVTTELATLATQ